MCAWCGARRGVPVPPTLYWLRSSELSSRLTSMAIGCNLSRLKNILDADDGGNGYMSLTGKYTNSDPSLSSSSCARAGRRGRERVGLEHCNDQKARKKKKRRRK